MSARLLCALIALTGAACPDVDSAADAGPGSEPDAGPSDETPDAGPFPSCTQCDDCYSESGSCPGPPEWAEENPYEYWVTYDGPVEDEPLLVDCGYPGCLRLVDGCRAWHEKPLVKQDGSVVAATIPACGTELWLTEQHGFERTVSFVRTPDGVLVAEDVFGHGDGERISYVGTSGERCDDGCYERVQIAFDVDEPIVLSSGESAEVTIDGAAYFAVVVWGRFHDFICAGLTDVESDARHYWARLIRLDALPEADVSPLPDTSSCPP